MSFNLLWFKIPAFVLGSKCCMNRKPHTDRVWSFSDHTVAIPVFSSVLYVDNHLEQVPLYEIPSARKSQVHFASSTSLIVQSGTLFRED